MIRPDVSALRKQYKTLSRKQALARINKVILAWETELIYFETSDLKTLEWLREQTKEEYDEYLKPILQNKVPKYFHDDEPDTPLTKRLALEGRHDQIRRNIGALKHLREEIKEWPSEEENKEGLQKKGQQTRLTINQIALKHYYEGNEVTKNNCNEIIRQYGHQSGSKLYIRYCYFTSTANRKGTPTPCTPRKLTNKINLIESVIKTLPKNKKSLATNDMNYLKSLFDSEYK